MRGGIAIRLAGAGSCLSRTDRVEPARHLARSCLQPYQLVGRMGRIKWHDSLDLECGVVSRERGVLTRAWNSSPLRLGDDSRLFLDGRCLKEFEQGDVDMHALAHTGDEHPRQE